ncbi:FecR domain-containing protein [Paraburkholderia sp. RG36]|uniref:FecR domain-containing protein n=2 Tax=Paraburkholderia tagetis TaxID=2913261 RepID=A0A9X1RKU7_9BURK|nr:FecR domain-containing protein [Paraburkholderia tagetis]
MSGHGSAHSTAHLAAYPAAPGRVKMAVALSWPSPAGPAPLPRAARAHSPLTGALACALALGLLPAAGRAEARKPQGQTPEMAVYVTRPGDSLYNVATRYLRNPADWTRLARINRVSTPRHLQPGTSLRVPVALLRQDHLSARVIATSGPARHAFGGGRLLPLVVGGTLVEGDRVQTGENGFATLELADGSHIVVPPGASLDLATLRQTVLTGSTDRVIDLHRGQVNTEVTKATRKDDRFQIRSPSVVAGVRGTSFRVNYDGDKGSTAVEVIEGAVGVDAASRGQAASVAPAPGTPLAASSQLVAARHGSITLAGGAVGVPVALLDAPDLLHPSKVQDDEAVAFDLAPVKGAHRYHLQIGRDAGLLDLIRDTHSDEPHVTVGALEDGTYFVRVSAIDENGLEGMPSTYAFQRRHLAMGASAGQVEGTRDYAFRWFVDQRRAGNTRFRFVLATSADLRAPLVDRTDIANGEAVVSDLPKGVYYWTVIAEQFEGGRYFQKASPVQSFRLD